MSELLKRLQVFYKKQGISAAEFHCRYYSSCKSGYNDFTEAKGTFVSAGFEHSIPRLLFISLDPGREEYYRQPQNRALLNVQKHEMERDITALPKNRHWYRTVELAQIILKKFNEYHDLHINQATQYFAHINTVKCCVNNPGNKKADDRLFKNCKSFVPQEVEILNPNIIVTQGNEARQTIADHYETHNPSDYLINLSHPKELKILYVNNHPVLWIHTFHPSNYGQFNIINYKNYNLYAEIAIKFIEEVYNYQKESKRIKIEPKEVKTIMWFTSDFFDKDNLQIPKDILNLINLQPYVKKISDIRRRIRKQFKLRGAKEVFVKWRPDPEWNHAFTFNKGARNELQANIGIWGKGIKGIENRKRGVRLGYGLNFSGGRFGEPLEVSKFLDIMMGLLQDNNSVTSKIWKNLSPIYYVEYQKKHNERVWNDINFENLFDCLKTEDAFWLFFGRFIGIKAKDDIPSILDDKKSLVFINEFFEKTLDFYEEVLGKYYSQS